MKILLFRLWQWIWGLPQNLLGLIIYLLHRSKPHSTCHGCVVTHWGGTGSMGLGMFLFLGDAKDPQVLIHEFGHSIQSAILGPLFLPVMGIPSYLWCNLPVCRRMRKSKGLSYYAFYSESSANFLGSLVTKETCSLK